MAHEGQGPDGGQDQACGSSLGIELTTPQRGQRKRRPAGSRSELNVVPQATAHMNGPPGLSGSGAIVGWPKGKCKRHG
jgi:hypothetical protein